MSYLIVFLSFFAVKAEESSFALDRDSCVWEQAADWPFTYIKVAITNTTDAPLELAWKAEFLKQPPFGWKTSIGDSEGIYYSENTGSFQLSTGDPVQDGFIVMHFYPEDIPGNAVANIHLWNAADPADKRTIYYDFTAKAITGIENDPFLREEYIRQGTVSIGSNKHAEIYDTNGRLIAKADNGYDTNALKKGVYFLVIRDQESIKSFKFLID